MSIQNDKDIFGTGLLAVTIGTLSLAMTPIASMAQGAQETISLEGIVITANKREQELGKIDASVSVRTGEQISQAGVTKVAELEKVFPGLVIRTRGNRAYSSFTVRGVSSTDFYSPSVQVYVDGVPQSEAFLTQDLINVERVEFLRGPQGTLYGRNAYAGVLNIITKRPETTTASVEATGTNKKASLDIAATAAVVPGTFYVDLTGRLARDFGQIDDVDTGTDGIDEGKFKNGSLRLRYAPTGGPFDATFQIAHDQTETGEEVYLFDDLIKERAYHSFLQGPSGQLDRKTTTSALAWNYRFDNFTLSSTTAFQDLDMARQVSGYDFPESKRTWSEELRLAFDGERLDGVLGVYLQSDEFTRETVYLSAVNNVDTQTAAVFGEATWHVSPVIDLTAGLRYAYDKAEIDYRQNLNFPPFYVPYGFENSADFTSLQPKAAVGFQVAPNLRIYGQVAKGYKPGGFNHAVTSAADQAPYDPENAINYEVGMRGSLAGGDFSYSLAGYRINATDKQIYVGIVPFQVIQNAAETSSTGVEAEANWQATRQLSFAGNITYGRSIFEDFTDAGVNYDGNRLPYAPDLTGSLQARYVFEQNYFPGPVALQGSMSYTGETYFNEANTLSQEGYFLFDAALEIGVADEAKLTVFGNNLTDEAFRTYSYAQGTTILSTIGEGRVVGAKLKMDF